MTYAFAEVTAPEEYESDSVPETENVEYACQVCGREAGPYGGRGRKPKFCEEHKKSRTSSSSGPRKVSGNAAALATQATAALLQINGFMAMGAMLFGLYKTAGSIAESNKLFEEQVYQALLTDTELCKTILKTGGGMGARTMLGIAYAGWGMSVLPVAYMEFKEKREAREVELENG